MTQTSGRSVSSVSHTVSSSVSARISTFAAPPRRSARSFTCATDSSPVISRTRRSRSSPAARRGAASTCRPRARRRRARATPGTMPPPRTRSSSGTPVGMRSASSTLTSTSRSSGFGGAFACPDLADDLFDERPEGVAARALPEPPPGRVPALGARELDRRLRHRASLWTVADKKVTPNAQICHSQERGQTPRFARSQTPNARRRDRHARARPSNERPSQAREQESAAAGARPKAAPSA